MKLEYETDIIVGVKKVKEHSFRTFSLKSDKLIPLNDDFLEYHQRQLRPDEYYPTGSIYTFWAENINTYGTMYGSRISPLIIKDIVIDIDNQDDFDQARYRMFGLNSNFEDDK